MLVRENEALRSHQWDFQMEQHNNVICLLSSNLQVSKILHGGFMGSEFFLGQVYICKVAAIKIGELLCMR